MRSSKNTWQTFLAGGRGSSKYHNHKVEVDGQVFDSRKELRRWSELVLMERAGEITDLRRQVKYTLIPTQRDDRGKLLEKECSYHADFDYRTKDGKHVVEDVKGYRGNTGAYNLFVLKRKLMLWKYKIMIREV